MLFFFKHTVAKCWDFIIFHSLETQNVTQIFLQLLSLFTDWIIHFTFIKLQFVQFPNGSIYTFLNPASTYTFRFIYICTLIFHSVFLYNFIFLQNYINIQRFSGEKNSFSTIIIYFFLLMRVLIFVENQIFKQNWSNPLTKMRDFKV